ncbi:MAG: hypothetical protein K0R81_127 [Microbacterium sp.]|nr:hypothetical protein [Microbacterium sp.]
MFEDCPSPDLTTASRARRRDGFVHFRGGGKHAPESINHRQGKAVVAAWLRHLYGAESVAVEEATDTQRSNVADVLLTHPSGRRAAFEVQYAPLSVNAWRERHERYVAQGIIDIWLWGHTRVHKSRSSYAIGPYRLDDTQEELRQSGMRVTFLNPETAQIGVATSPWSDEPCLATGREFDLAVGPIFGAEMCDDGVTSELIRRLAAVSRRRKAELAREAEQADRRREAFARAAAERERQRAERLVAEQARQVEREARSERIAELRRQREELAGRDPLRGRPAPPAQPSTQTEEVALTEPSRAPEQVRVSCRVCGQPLDPILASLGCHVGPCEWRLGRR